MESENNVAAQAGDSPTRDIRNGSGELVAIARHSCEPGIAAQAGDEPMRAVIALAWKWSDEAVADGFAASEPAQELFELLGWPDRGARISPRATADVKRNSRLHKIADSIEADGLLDTATELREIIATTEPGA